jgi:integrase
VTTKTRRKAADKRRLSELLVKRVRPRAKPFLIWDTKSPGLALRVRPSGARGWYFVYSRHNRARWYRLGDATAIGLADARLLAGEAALSVAKGGDPAAEKRAQRSKGTFAELAACYVEQHAKKNNKSWRQADALVRRQLIPRWGKLQASAITRSDVKAMMAGISAPITANQVLASASAVFSWAAKEELMTGVNPCKDIDRNPTTSRERVLADREVPKFWAAFDNAGLMQSTALKLILLLGQRPGEITHMRREHIVDNWWTMPGAPVPALGWPGVKNKQNHRIWLSKRAQELLAELNDDQTTGFVFASPRGGPIGKLDPAMRAICQIIGAPRTTPHDLRRTCGTLITGLGLGREAMDRVMNHKEGGVGDVYDRADYGPEIKRVMEKVAAHITALVEGQPVDMDNGNVVPMAARK